MNIVEQLNDTRLKIDVQESIIADSDKVHEAMERLHFFNQKYNMLFAEAKLQEHQEEISSIELEIQSLEEERKSANARRRQQINEELQELTSKLIRLRERLAKSQQKTA